MSDISGEVPKQPQSPRSEGSMPKRTILPPATKEDMIASEAAQDIEANYRASGHDPKAFPENVAKKVAKRVREIGEIVSLDSNALTGGRIIEKSSPPRIPEE